MSHKIKTAYDAYHFLLEHPGFSVNERIQVDPAKADKMVDDGYAITKDRDGTCWREYRHVQLRALEMNLSIHYAKVDKQKRVNDDPAKNTLVECWLEFGPIAYQYHWDGDVATHLCHTHDPALDTGAATFDEALVKLARRVLKQYGDYNVPKRKDDCGAPVCADCIEYEQSEIAKELEAQ